jgi:hypothetical protein
MMSLRNGNKFDKHASGSSFAMPANMGLLAATMMLLKGAIRSRAS